MDTPSLPKSDSHRAITWQAIRAVVLHRIQTRAWAPGMMIPNEADLAIEFGCARATVNRALRDLAQAGLLERRRKAGTRVRSVPVRMATLEIPIIRLDIAARGLEPGYRLLSQTRTPPPPALRKRLRLPAEARMDHITALHLADGMPFVLEDRWINPAAVPDMSAVDFADISANEWLVLNAPFSHGDITFSALSASGDVARALNAPMGAALFVIDRTTWRETSVITDARLIYAPGHSIRTTL